MAVFALVSAGGCSVPRPSRDGGDLDNCGRAERRQRRCVSEGCV